MFTLTNPYFIDASVTVLIFDRTSNNIDILLDQ